MAGIDTYSQQAYRPVDSGPSRSGAPRQSGQPTEGLDRVPPHSIESEACVLGSMILDPECIGEVVESLNSEAFYRIEHQMIFDALVTLYEKNRAEGLDAVLLRNELEKRKQLDEVGSVDDTGGKSRCHEKAGRGIH